MPTPRITVPLSYQGGKQRLAAQVVDLWWPTGQPFVELCCGSGAVSIEMLNRGFAPEDITMVDAGPWGRFWQKVGDGTFDTDRFEERLDDLPKDPGLIQQALLTLSREPVADDAAEVFPILQAGTFGAKALWTADGKWKNTTFRSYWMPTATSSRRSPVNPMMPMPDTLRRRVLDVVAAMRGVHGACADAQTAPIPSDSVVYIDPPYDGTTAYGHTLDAAALAGDLTHRNHIVFVSEGRPLTDDAVLLHAGRAKGGISGARKVIANEEWVSAFGRKPAAPTAAAAAA
ncbi:hypothetical protein [Curtobacterium sp. MCBD17_040]|uniref:hypothetical protein n=1 Tax=Curtobacterium sp. MCBD17_040 TaxID=2175674 RepID=UPI000DA6EB7F|nr:hypothetical protein [Curtobacterium sp. MCBD17_040]WIB65656.1 hypothetical protein DEI94_16175 [Curtobacterium sp. MCBD17_040]